MSDPTLKESIQKRFDQSSEIDASGIEVVVKRGHVTLIGAVGESRILKVAERLIQDLPGVVEVTNELEVKGKTQIERASRDPEEVQGPPRTSEAV